MNVAFGSEYRALVNLPGVDGAQIWEQTRKPYFGSIKMQI